MLSVTMAVVLPLSPAEISEKRYKMIYIASRALVCKPTKFPKTIFHYFFIALMEPLISQYFFAEATLGLCIRQ